jgi:8-oxo-dGTP diphosphatase
MKLLLELSDKDFDEGSSERFEKPYRLRKASRAIILNENNEVAIQFASKYNYHKLPGGGLDEGETILDALHREIKEEVGCEVEVGEKVGLIIEYRNQFDVLQMSYCYLAKVKGDVGEPEWEEGELEEGFESIWVPLDQAISLLEADKPKEYKNKFIVKRDLVLLKEAQRLLGN